MGAVFLLLFHHLRQTMLVILKGTRADAVVACIMSSFLWQNVTTFTHTANRKVQISGTSCHQMHLERRLFHTKAQLWILDDLTADVFPDINYNKLNWQ